MCGWEPLDRHAFGSLSKCSELWSLEFSPGRLTFRQALRFSTLCFRAVNSRVSGALLRRGNLASSWRDGTDVAMATKKTVETKDATTKTPSKSKTAKSKTAKKPVRAKKATTTTATTTTVRAKKPVTANKTLVAKKPVAKKPKATTKAAASNVETIATPEERVQRIAVAAYLRAESRGFAQGGEVEDWLCAEREIDSRFASQPS